MAQLRLVRRCCVHPVKTTLFCLLFFAATLPMRAQDYGRVVYFSPDNKLQAVVIPTYKQERGFNEHRIEIRSLNDQRVATNDHSSVDHEHGYGVIFAGWTPDSRFFVYSVASSGGHSAWHFPTYVFVRDHRAFFNLDELLDQSFVKPQFVLWAPNRFLSERLSSERYVPVDISLQDVKWPKAK